MKRPVNIVVVLLLMMFFGSMHVNSYAILNFQDKPAKKAKPRLSLDFRRVMEGESYLTINSRVREGKAYVNIHGLTVKVFLIVEEEERLLGEVITDHKGDAVYTLKESDMIPTDTTGYIRYEIRSASNDLYSSADDDLLVLLGDIDAKVSKTDSTLTVRANLVNHVSGEAVPDATIKVLLKRQFAPLTLGKDFYTTDEEGKLKVNLKNNLPGDAQGNLVIQVVLEDDENYRNIVKEVVIPTEVMIARDNSYDESSMWSSRYNTPWWLLVFPNLIIFGVWMTMFYLVYKLIIISKSN
ncbi:MAG: hypothetical protein OEY51_07970 [Cyclobacteriaceae bacterium]|nr:hypothetical protein [Cyclobacteriaceae bacterium]